MYRHKPTHYSGVALLFASIAMFILAASSRRHAVTTPTPAGSHTSLITMSLLGIGLLVVGVLCLIKARRRASIAAAE